MTVTTTVSAIPRMIVAGYLQAVRLPLTAAERATGQRSNHEWPPALAFERFEAGVESVLGSVLRDPALTEKGRLRHAKLAQLDKASRLAAAAEVESEQAEERLRQEQDALAREQAETERRADQRKQEVDRQAHLHERKVQEKAAKKAETAREVKATQDEAITRQERAATLKARADESRALGTAKKALEADETVDVIADTLEGTKAARKS